MNNTEENSVIAKGWAGEEIRRRWSLIVFVTNPKDLDTLQAKEKDTLDLTGLNHRGMESLIHQYNLKPFWPQGLSTDQKQERMSRFYSQIYLTWIKIVMVALGVYDKEVEAWNALPYNTRTVTKEPHLSFINILHNCDWAIYQSGHKPDRFTPADPRVAEKKDSILRKVKQAQGI